MATKIRARTINGETEIAVRIDHPMEDGTRTDAKTQSRIPAHFIQKVTFAINGRELVVADLGPTVSKDPLVKIRARRLKPRDIVSVSWTDNRGTAEKQEISIP